MDVPVRLARRTRKDVREIVAFIARDNPARAERYGDEFPLKAQSLARHPWMGRVVPGQGEETMREIVHGPYRIVYRVTPDPDRVLVLRFWHAARGNPQIVED